MHPRKRGEQVSQRALSGAAAAGGAAIGGPLGALAGRAVEGVGSELLERLLSHAERRRIEAARAMAKADLEARLKRGEKLREDDYFRAPPTLGSKMFAPWGASRPPAEEIMEAIYLFAGRTYEERKLPHLEALGVALMFDSEVSPTYAQHLARLANALSYRQLLLLAVFHNPSPHARLTDGDVRPDSRSGVGIEMQELARLGLIGLNEPTEDAYPTASILEVGLTFIMTTYHGRKLWELMKLETLPEQGVRDVVEELVAGTQPRT